MTLKQRTLTANTLFSEARVIPVMVIHNIEHALPLARALVAGGIRVLEVTLRTTQALEAIARLREHIPEAIVGAGTVLTPEDLDACVESGAQFALSPGLTQALLKAGAESDIPFIPGVSSSSEIMEGLAYGYRHFKFFPAEAAGGVKALKALIGPFPDVSFCPTGGINRDNFLHYLALKNVQCVGGSWILPDELIQQNRWEAITDLCLSTLQLNSIAY